MTKISINTCEICNKPFGSTMALSSHQRAKKHGKYSDNDKYSGVMKATISHVKHPIEQEIRNHKNEVFTSIIDELTRRKKDEELKTALREQLAVDERPYYNVEAYQIAIRTMTIGEAYKLAKDDTRSLELIEANKHPEQVHVIEKDTNVFQETVTSTIGVTSIRGEKVEVNTWGRDTADQSVFRKAVSLNYGHRCVLTGDTIAIEAAHIQTHNDHYDNSIDNGIMLSVGLHRLFDKGIMIINPESMTVHFTQDCFYKKHLEGAIVKPGKIAINKDKLRAKNKL
ncbi:TPA: HNH endonuclease [Serratia fonticola]